MTIKVDIRSENHARALALYLKRITFEDAYRRTDCGYSDEDRKEQAYTFLHAINDVEKGLNDAGIFSR